MPHIRNYTWQSWVPKHKRWLVLLDLVPLFLVSMTISAMEPTGLSFLIYGKMGVMIIPMSWAVGMMK